MKRTAILLISVASLVAIIAVAAAKRGGDAKRAVASPVVVVKTSMGTFKVELFADRAPVTVKNILAYVDAKFYDGTIFHRVIPTFVIQGGGFDANLTQKPTRAPIVNEADNGVKNTEGTLSMARTSDPDSATSQFFVNVKDNPALDRNPASAGYAVFGKVVEGMDVVHKIKLVPTGIQGGMRDVPATPVVIESIRRQ